MCTKTDNLPELLTPNEAAELTRTSPKFIRDQCKAGRIKAAKVGGLRRVGRDSVLATFGLA